jgi:DNA-binding response OmpR family regulator
MGKKILLIEDDPFLSSLLGNRLKKEGFEVIPVKVASEVIKAARDSHPDLILLDLILPGKSGFEVLEEMKLDVEIARVPVIVISNLGQEGDMQRGKELGAVDYIVKAKITMDEMVAKIKDFFDGK